MNISEDVDVVPCEGTDAASRITKVGDDARGPSACKTTLAHIGETPVCIEELD